MGPAVGEILALGLAVAVSPLAIIAVVLMLAVPGGRVSAWAFLGGWVAGLAAVTTVALLLADAADADEASGPATWVGIAKLAVGLILLVVGGRELRGARGEEHELPAWMARVDGVRPGRAAGLAVVLVAVKPKNLLLAVAAALAIAQQGIEPGQQAATLAVFIALGTLGPGVPVAIHALPGGRGTAILDILRRWMVRENATVIAVLCLVIGVKLIGDAIGVLTG